ncbi:unnamed protein product [Amoebophrya sp. A25]|nr:unnamed protein product [Amoebophrya sp. A25]|eukprot:GSA25T00027050001.1
MYVLPRSPIILGGEQVPVGLVVQDPQPNLTKSKEQEQQDEEANLLDENNQNYTEMSNEMIHNKNITSRIQTSLQNIYKMREHTLHTELSAFLNEENATITIPWNGGFQLADSYFCGLLFEEAERRGLVGEAVKTSSGRVDQEEGAEASDSTGGPGGTISTAAKNRNRVLVTEENKDKQTSRHRNRVASSRQYDFLGLGRLDLLWLTPHPRVEDLRVLQELPPGQQGDPKVVPGGAGKQMKTSTQEEEENKEIFKDSKEKDVEDGTEEDKTAPALKLMTTASGEELLSRVTTQAESPIDSEMSDRSSSIDSEMSDSISEPPGSADSSGYIPALLREGGNDGARPLEPLWLFRARVQVRRLSELLRSTAWNIVGAVEDRLLGATSVGDESSGKDAVVELPGKDQEDKGLRLLFPSSSTTTPVHRLQEQAAHTTNGAEKSLQLEDSSITRVAGLRYSNKACFLPFDAADAMGLMDWYGICHREHSNALTFNRLTAFNDKKFQIFLQLAVYEVYNLELHLLNTLLYHRAPVYRFDWATTRVCEKFRVREKIFNHMLDPPRNKNGKMQLLDQEPRPGKTTSGGSGKTQGSTRNKLAAEVNEEIRFEDTDVAIGEERGHMMRPDGTASSSTSRISSATATTTTSTASFSNEHLKSVESEAKRVLQTQAKCVWSEELQLHLRNSTTDRRKDFDQSLLRRWRRFESLKWRRASGDLEKEWRRFFSPSEVVELEDGDEACKNPRTALLEKLQMHVEKWYPNPVSTFTGDEDETESAANGLAIGTDESVPPAATSTSRAESSGEERNKGSLSPKNIPLSRNYSTPPPTVETGSVDDEFLGLSLTGEEDQGRSVEHLRKLLLYQNGGGSKALRRGSAGSLTSTTIKGVDSLSVSHIPDSNNKLLPSSTKSPEQVKLRRVLPDDISPSVEHHLGGTTTNETSPERPPQENYYQDRLDITAHAQRNHISLLLNRFFRSRSNHGPLLFYGDSYHELYHTCALGAQTQWFDNGEVTCRGYFRELLMGLISRSLRCRDGMQRYHPWVNGLFGNTFIQASAENYKLTRLETDLFWGACELLKIPDLSLFDGKRFDNVCFIFSFTKLRCDEPFLMV